MTILTIISRNKLNSNYWNKINFTTMNNGCSGNSSNRLYTWYSMLVARKKKEWNDVAASRGWLLSLSSADVHSCPNSEKSLKNKMDCKKYSSNNSTNNDSNPKRLLHQNMFNLMNPNKDCTIFYHLLSPKISRSFSSLSFLGDSISTKSTNTQQHERQKQQQQLSFYSEEQKNVMKRCDQLHQNILSYNKRWHGPLDESSHGTSSTTSKTMPLVLLLGNHSSGKSTFCNYILGRSVQTSGVAPTDDCFTIISPGPVDTDQDGIALTGNPDLGFMPLRHFGPTLLHHTVFKVRKDTQTNFILVDSPGMIDAPGNYSGMMMATSTNTNLNPSSSASNSASNSTARMMDRGYDFTGVVRWLANRADVVVLFFDPDKPGTTGETLSVLLYALNGMDHKLLIVLNKADQFTKIQDFARAYGSLCWNLSKVIPRKDLPRIYTMCLPTGDNNYNLKTANDTGATTDGTTTTPTAASIPSGLQDLYNARDEVVSEVFKAPSRRLDNIITDLQYAVQQLYMHGIIVQDIQTRWTRYNWQLRTKLLSVGLGGTTITGLLMAVLQNKSSILIPLPGLEYITGGVFATTILATAGLNWYQKIQLEQYKLRYVHSTEELLMSFQRTHRKAVRDADEYTASIWQQIKNPLHQSMTEYKTSSEIPIVTSAELETLQSILEKDLPELRRQASPDHYYGTKPTN